MTVMNTNDHDLLIRIDNTVSSVLTQVKEFRQEQADTNNRVTQLEISQGTQKEQIFTLKQEVDKLRGINVVWNSINSLASLIAGIAGIRP